MRVRPLAVSIALFLVFVACADAPIDPGDGGTIDHTTGRDEVLVKISNEGGFVPLEWTYTNLPIFSLYGDGTLVLPGPQIELYPGPALPAISRRQIDEAGIQAILQEALATTEDIPADLDDLGFAGIADASTTVIRVSAAGVDRTIRAYALGELTERPDGMPEREYRARRELLELVTQLSALEPWLPDGSVGPEGAYEARSARVFVGTYRHVDDLAQQPKSWPLDDGLPGFGGPADGSGRFRCGVLGGTDWIDVRDAASTANELTPWTDAGAEYSILFRPLLPDESGC
jgi:hypothetical protein